MNRFVLKVYLTKCKEKSYYFINIYNQVSHTIKAIELQVVNLSLV